MSPDSYDWLETLQLDRTTLERVASRTAQWARATFEQGASMNDRRPARSLADAASLQVLATSYRFALQSDDALESASRATRLLLELRSPLAHTMGVCSADAEVAFRVVDTAPDVPPSQRAAVMTALAWGTTGSGVDSPPFANMLNAHEEQGRLWATAPTGRLRIPLGTTMDLLLAAAGDDRRDLAGALRSFLLRAHDVVAAAMRDRYHWRNLLSSVLPVEPEAAAAAAVVARAAAARDETTRLETMIEDLPPVARVPYWVGTMIARGKT